MMSRAGLAIPALVALAGCDEQAGAGPVFSPDYRGIETRLLEGELVQFKVRMAGARTTLDGTHPDTASHGALPTSGEVQAAQGGARATHGHVR